MKRFLIILIVMMLAFGNAFALDPVRCALFYTDGGSVEVAVQLFDFNSNTNEYPGNGNKSIGSLNANSSGVISFEVGKGDPAWAAIAPSDVSKYHVLIVYLDGEITAFLRLDELIVEQGVYGSTIEEDVISIPDGKILIGDGNDEAVSHSITGDADFSNAGVLTVTGLQDRAVAATAPSNGQVLTWDNGDSQWEPKTPSPGVSLSSENTWTRTQKFQDGGAYRVGVNTVNSNIILTNTDVEQDIRFQEPASGPLGINGTYYVGFRCPDLPDRAHNYLFPSSVGSAGQVLTILSKTTGTGYFSDRDSAVLGWTTPSAPGIMGGYAKKFVYKFLDQSISGSSMLQDDDELSVEWGSEAGTYLVEGCIYVSDAAQTKFKFKTIGQGKPLYSKYSQQTATAQDLNTEFTAGEVGMTQAIFFKIMVEAPADVRGIQFQFAQTMPSGNAVTIGRGSYMSYSKIQ
jgi:hypothetical protein